MASNMYSNKTTSRDVIPKTTDKTSATVVPISDEITDDEIREYLYLNDSETIQTRKDDDIVSHNQSHSLRIIGVRGIPNYLSFETNKTFERMAQQNIYRSATSINIDILGQIAILMHQSAMLHLEKSLWTIYYKSGTGILKPNESNLKIWPTSMKSMIESAKGIITTDDFNEIEMTDDICFKFTTEYLCKLNEEEQQIQQELSLKKAQFHGYSIAIEETLMKFIQEHTQSSQLRYNFDIAMIMYGYQENVFEIQFQQQNPNEHQKQLITRLCSQQFDYQKAKQEVLLLKQQIAHNTFPKPLDSLHISLSSAIPLLTDTDLGQQLSDRHRRIIQQYKNEMTIIFTDTMEAKLQDSQTLFENEVAKMWQGQHSLRNDQQLSRTMTSLIVRHLTMISSKMECSYKHKFQQQQLLIKAPIVIQ